MGQCTVLAAVLCGSLVCQEAAGDTTTAKSLFGTKYVLQRFKDSMCKRIDDGQGATQSWVQIPGADSCYELTQGFLCTYRCIYKMSCQYDTGSGVVISRMDDLQCSGRGSDTRPLAQSWYWLQAQSLFNGGCIPDGSGKYMMFATPLNGYPDCSSEGDVAPGTDDSALKYEASYNLQFYKDMTCTSPYVVSTFSERQTSSFVFKLYRGALYCYDMVDSTDRGNSSARDVGWDMLNWRFICGNVDMVGNGYMIGGYDAPKCTGRSTASQSWKDVFYTMNFPDTMSLFRGQCVRWGQFSARFLSPWDPVHFPDCTDWACKDPKMPCSGGRVSDPSNTVGTAYTGSIRTSGGDPTWPLSRGNGTVSPAPRAGVPSAVWVLASSVAAAAAMHTV